MAEGDDDVVVETVRHRNGWIVVPCLIGSEYNLEFMLNTGRPLSYISVDTYENLSAAGLCDHIGGSIYRVRRLVMAGREMPPLFVRVSAAVAALGFEGMLGLHFLNQFGAVHFERDSGRLTLTY